MRGGLVKVPNNESEVAPADELAGGLEAREGAGVCLGATVTETGGTKVPNGELEEGWAVAGERAVVGLEAVLLSGVRDGPCWVRDGPCWKLPKSSVWGAADTAGSGSCRPGGIN